MINPWELKSDDERSSDSLYTFIIFCEDEISEFYYFKWFETDLIKVNIINRQKSMLTNVTKAITYCSENEILIYDDEKYKLEQEGIEIWSVYDRDIESNPTQIVEKNNEFNISIRTAKENCINVAWSNDAFELWIMLHLNDVPNHVTMHSRNAYYDFLTDYFKTHPNPNEDLLRALRHASFSYKKDMKHRDNFTNIVRGEILPFTTLAIERSRKLLESHCKTPHYYDKKPCTTVHLLVERLLETGMKNLPKL